MTTTGTQQDWDDIQKLANEVQRKMDKFRSAKERRSGPYGKVGQAIYRVGDGLNYFNEHVQRPS